MASRLPANPSRLPPPAVAARQSPPIPPANPGNRQTSFSPPPPPPGGNARPPAPQASGSTSAARYANAMDVDQGASPAAGPPKATRLPPQAGHSAGVPVAAVVAPLLRPAPQHPNGLGTGSLINRAHPGLATPRPPPTPDAQKLLETVVRRLVNLVPTYLAEHHAPPAAVLDTLWLDDEAREGFEKAYREKEKKASDERKVKMNAAYAQTASDMNTFLEAEFVKLEPVARIVAVERAVEELRRTGGGSSAPQDGRAPSPAGSVEHQRLVAELKQKVVTLESELQEQRSSAHAMQQQMDGLAERVKVDVSAAWEARFVALEGKLSASAAVDRPSPNPPPAPAPAMTEEVVSQLATLEAKGRNLARGVGLPWEASEKSLGKRKMDGEGEEAKEDAEREKSLVERLEGLRVEGGQVGKRVGVVEGRVEELEKQAGERKAQEDVEMKEPKAAEVSG